MRSKSRAEGSGPNSKRDFVVKGKENVISRFKQIEITGKS